MCYVQWKYFGLFHLPYLLYIFIFCSIRCYCWLAAWTILLYGFPDIVLIFLFPPLQFILISTLMDSSFFSCPEDTGISWKLFLICPFPSLFCMLFSSTHGFTICILMKPNLFFLSPYSLTISNWLLLIWY